MYVLDEAFDGWYMPKNHHDYSRVFWGEYKSDLSTMVERDYNHPSVIIYSIGNEVSEVGTETYIGDLTYNWSRVMSSNALIGDFCWVAMDYIGEAGIGAWQYEANKEMPLLAGSGAIDILGNADAQNGFQKVVWGLEDIYIGVRPVNMSSQKVLKKAWRFTDAIPSWNWPGYEGEKAHVEVYSNGSYVKLELNGKTLGKKRVKGHRTDFVCKYDKGTLTAISYDLQGKELARAVLSSGHGISELSVKAEKKT